MCYLENFYFVPRNSFLFCIILQSVLLLLLCSTLEVCAQGIASLLWGQPEKNTFFGKMLYMTLKIEKCYLEIMRPMQKLLYNVPDSCLFLNLLNRSIERFRRLVKINSNQERLKEASALKLNIGLLFIYCFQDSLKKTHFSKKCYI